MYRKGVITIILTLFLASMLALKFDVQSATAEPKTWTVDDDGPADFHTIHEAVANATDGDLIIVYSGLYYEHLTLDKSLTLVGENEQNTIVDGNKTDTVITVTADNVTISQFTIQNSNQSLGTAYAGIRVSGRHCNITGNNLTKNRIGIFVNTEKSRITKNIVNKNGQGIALYDCSEVTVKENNLTANTVGISLAYSSNNTVIGNNVSNSSAGGHGITLTSNSFNNTILNNTIRGNYHGIWLSNSFNNSILGNSIENNELLGIELANSSNNILFHNIFIDNPKHVKSDDQANIWDDGYPSGGNYWSDYELKYPNASELDSSCIWDTPYVINQNNQDNHPLMPCHRLVPEFPSLLILQFFMAAMLVVIIKYRTRLLCVRSSEKE